MAKVPRWEDKILWRSEESGNEKQGHVKKKKKAGGG